MYSFLMQYLVANNYFRMKPLMALLIWFCISLAAAVDAAWTAAFWTCWPMASMVLLSPPRLDGQQKIKLKRFVLFAWLTSTVYPDGSKSEQGIKMLVRG